MTPPTDAEFAAILGNVSKHIMLTPEEQRFWRGMLRSKFVGMVNNERTGGKPTSGTL